jgi:nucleotide-binding universal stress UspA family protein
MAVYKKILVLVDGSRRSIQTVNYVKDFMPVDKHTRIVLFHVFNGTSETYRELGKDSSCVRVVQELKTRETKQKIKIKGFLERAKKILIAGGFPERCIETQLHCMEKGVARDIIDEAGNGYSAVVLGRRGMGRLSSIILGSVAVKLLASLTFIPVLIVGPAPPVKKILLAVDASPFSMKAVQFAGSLLGGQGYEVCVFHAILGLGAIDFEPPGHKRPQHPDVQMPDNCMEGFKLKVAGLFQNVREMLTAFGFESEKIFEKIVSGVYSRSEAIIREAESGGYGTIVVGRRGLSKVEAFFMGRVGHKVVYGGKRFTVWVV